jgi:hypothetical protein
MIPAHSQSIGLVCARVTSDAKWLEVYVGRFLGRFVPCPGEVSLDCRFHSEPLVRPSKSRSTWGRNALFGADFSTFCADPVSGIWCDVTTQESADNSFRISCYPIHSRLRKLWNRLRARQGAREQLAMGMIRQGVLLPALSLATLNHQCVALHASVVASGDRAVVLTGLNGCGKSGLALHLVARHGYGYLSDNYGLIDIKCRRALTFPEPLRLGDRERESAAGFFTGEDRAFGKWQMLPNPQIMRSDAKVGCLVHTVIGERFEVSPISPDVFSRRLESLHRYLGETPEYSWLQIYFLWKHGKDLAAIVEDLRFELCHAVPCYQLTLPHTHDLAARYRDATCWIRDQLSS